jgi:hypothetical protein
LFHVLAFCSIANNLNLKYAPLRLPWSITIEGLVTNVGVLLSTCVASPTYEYRGSEETQAGLLTGFCSYRAS